MTKTIRKTEIRMRFSGVRARILKWDHRVEGFLRSVSNSYSRVQLLFVRIREVGTFYYIYIFIHKRTNLNSLVF